MIPAAGIPAKVCPLKSAGGGEKFLQYRDDKRILGGMGYDFSPRNKKAGDYHLGAFSWPHMLDAGLGLVLGTGQGFKPGEFIYIKRHDNLCVQYNDGARVSASECKDLAKVARWIAAIQHARINQWETVSQEEQKRMRDDQHGTYKLPWHPDAVNKFRDFADWCEKSGGFTIH